MDKNVKDILKNTLLGLLAGGTVSSAYALHKNKEDSQANAEFKENEIVVPLSRRNYMKAVRKVNNKTTPTNVTDKKNIGNMTPAELRNLKRSLINKQAEQSQPASIKNISTPSSKETAVKNVKGLESTRTRDEKGRFSATKQAEGTMYDALGVGGMALGTLGGVAGGLSLGRLLADKIILNRKKQQVEKSRRRYTDMLAKEVNDDDTPYYQKQANANKTAAAGSSDTSGRGIFGTTLGLLGASAVGTAATFGLLAYRIAENRRKDELKRLDRDLANYPVEKTIKFRFPKEKRNKMLLA